MDFKREYELKKEYIDTVVSKYAACFSTPSCALADSVDYGVKTGGKRIRGILANEIYTYFNGKRSEGFEAFLAALELLHLYTLVHDDLPCMDNDEYRRGQLTVHRVFGEDMALLCGDALLNYAFELLFLSCKMAKGRDSERYITASLEFSRRTGGGGIIGGQALEFERGRIIDREHIEQIYRHKTCDLFVGGLAFAAIVAGASEEEIALVTEYGSNLGMAFQIRDDILDKDKVSEQEKNSLFGLIGEEKANIILEESLAKAIESLDKLGIKEGFLLKLTEFVALRSA